MTSIKYHVTKEKFYVEIQGHAGYAMAGNDIVCAAVSILVQTLAKHLENVTDNWDARIEGGYAFVRAEGEKAVDSFLTILTGFEMLQYSYPTYVCLIKGAL